MKPQRWTMSSYPVNHLFTSGVCLIGQNPSSSRCPGEPREEEGVEVAAGLVDRSGDFYDSIHQYTPMSHVNFVSYRNVVAYIFYD